MPPQQNVLENICVQVPITTQLVSFLSTAGIQVLSVLALLLLFSGFQPSAVAGDPPSIATTEAKKQHKTIIRHQQLKHQITQRLGRHYSRALPRPDKQVSRKLALFNPYSRELIPLFGSIASSVIHGHPNASDVLPVDVVAWDTVRNHVADLEKSWLWVLTDTDDLPLRILGAGRDGLDHLPGYHPPSRDKPGYLDLASLNPADNQEVLGVVDITEPGSPILVLGSGLEPDTHRLSLRADILEALKAVPDTYRGRLALVTAVPSQGSLRFSRLLMPINAVSTRKELLTSTGDVVFSAHEPIQQLTTKETIGESGPADDLLLSTAVTEDQHYRVDLVVDIKDSAGRPFYHRISGIKAPDQWHHHGASGDKPNLSDTPTALLKIPASRLLALAESPHLRNQQLYLMEHNPTHNRQAFYPLGRSINNQLLALETIGDRKTLDQLLEKSGPKGIKDVIHLTLPHRKPDHIVAPVAPEPLADLPQPIPPDQKQAKTAQAGMTKIYPPRELKKAAELVGLPKQGARLSLKGKGKKKAPPAPATVSPLQELDQAIVNVQQWLSGIRPRFPELNFVLEEGSQATSSGGQLALFHTPSETFIPLLNASDDGAHIKLSWAFFDTFVSTVPLSDDWLFTITRPTASGEVEPSTLPIRVHSFAS